MYDSRIQFALDNFIIDKYFQQSDSTYLLYENKESGKSRLKVNVSNENLCISDFDNKKKCGFLRGEKKFGMQKSVDHVLIEKCEEGWRLHMIEMKSSVGYKTWNEVIKPKMRTSYFNALAIAQFLGIDIVDVTTYTTYEKEQFESINNSCDVKSHIPLLGIKAYDAKADEWDKDRIVLNVGYEMVFKHKRVPMIRNSVNNVLEGELVI